MTFVFYKSTIEFLNRTCRSLFLKALMPTTAAPSKAKSKSEPTPVAVQNVLRSVVSMAVMSAYEWLPKRMRVAFAENWPYPYDRALVLETLASQIFDAAMKHIPEVSEVVAFDRDGFEGMVHVLVTEFVNRRNDTGTDLPVAQVRRRVKEWALA